MIPVRGNITAVIQVKDDGIVNEIGEKQHVWADVVALKGWLDLSNGQSDINSYKAKVQTSTHLFICDFKSFKNLSKTWEWNPIKATGGVIQSKNNNDKIDITSENARIIINNLVYHILLIDDPLGLHHHLEIMLKYIGGGLSV